VDAYAKGVIQNESTFGTGVYVLIVGTLVILTIIGIGTSVQNATEVITGLAEFVYGVGVLYVQLTYTTGAVAPVQDVAKYACTLNTETLDLPAPKLCQPVFFVALAVM